MHHRKYRFFPLPRIKLSEREAGKLFLEKVFPRSFSLIPNEYTLGNGHNEALRRGILNKLAL
jgi:hypothetical protein